MDIPRSHEQYRPFIERVCDAVAEASFNDNGVRLNFRDGRLVDVIQESDDLFGVAITTNGVRSTLPQSFASHVFGTFEFLGAVNA